MSAEESQESVSTNNHEHSVSLVQQSIKVRNEFRNKQAYCVPSIEQYLSSSEAAHFSVVGSSKPNSENKNNREAIGCLLHFDLSGSQPNSTDWSLFSSNTSSPTQTVNNICADRIVVIESYYEAYSQYCLEKYFARHKWSELRVVCVRLSLSRPLETDVFRKILRGMSLIRNYLSNVKSLLIIFTRDIYFKFLLQNAESCTLIEAILEKFALCLESYKETWKRGKIVKHLLDQMLVAQTEVQEILVSLYYYPNWIECYNALDMEKKNKIVWCWFAGIHFSDDKYPELESLCRVYQLNIHGKSQFRRYDFSVNPIVQSIDLKTEIPGFVFTLPGEIEVDNDVTHNIANPITKFVSASPHPLRYLIINNPKIDFYLNRLSFSFFGNLVKLALEVNNVTGVLQGKFLTSLKELRVCRLHENAILDFSDVEEPLSILRLVNCSGRVLMKACPATVEVAGSLNVNDENTFFANVRNLAITILKEDDIPQWNYLFQAPSKNFRWVKNKHPGKKVEVLAMEWLVPSPYEIHLLHNYKLKELSCTRSNTVIDGSLLPELKSLSLDSGQFRLMSTFTKLEKISLREASVYGRWDINLESLRSVIWHPDSKMCYIYVDNVAIRGFFGDASLREFRKLADHVPVEKSIVFPSFEKLDCTFGCTNGNLFNIIHYSNISNLTVSIPADIWFKLPKNELQCEIARFTILEKTDNTYDCKLTESDLPPMPKIKELTVTSSVSFVYLNENMPHLEYLSVGNHIQYGDKLRCPKIKFVEVTSQATFYDEVAMKTAFLSKNFGQDTLGNISPQTRWLLISRNCAVIKVVPPSSAQKSLAELAEPSSSSLASSRRDWCSCCF